MSQSSDTNAVSTLSAGNDLTITAGSDANLQAAQIEAERDVTIKAKNDVNLLAAQDVSNYKEMHEKLFVGVTAQVSTGLVSAADSVGNAAAKVANISDGYSAANAGFAGMKAFDAIDSIAKGGNIVSGSLTVGFNHSKQTAQGSSSVPVTTGIGGGINIYGGVGFGLTGNVSGSKASGNADGTSQVNSHTRQRSESVSRKASFPRAVRPQSRPATISCCRGRRSTAAPMST